jgi:hypothetical protein
VRNSALVGRQQDALRSKCGGITPEEEAMDQTRYDELMQRRDTSGLSDAEANELGRLMAEKRGESYGGADARKEAFDEEEAEEQRLRDHPASEGHTVVEDAELMSPPSGTQPGI